MSSRHLCDMSLSGVLLIILLFSEFFFLLENTMYCLWIMIRLFTIDRCGDYRQVWCVAFFSKTSILVVSFGLHQWIQLVDRISMYVSLRSVLIVEKWHGNAFCQFFHTLHHSQHRCRRAHRRQHAPLPALPMPGAGCCRQYHTTVSQNLDTVRAGEGVRAQSLIYSQQRTQHFCRHHPTFNAYITISPHKHFNTQ